MKGEHLYDYYQIHIEWENWISSSDSFEWEESGVLYLYGTSTEALYLGKANKLTVRKRYEGHKRDGLIHRIRQRTRNNWGVKIGRIDTENSDSLRDDIIGDVERIMIFMGRLHRQFRYNRSAVKGINTFLSHVFIFNHGLYKPLERGYCIGPFCRCYNH